MDNKRVVVDSFLYHPNSLVEARQVVFMSQMVYKEGCMARHYASATTVTIDTLSTG